MQCRQACATNMTFYYAASQMWLLGRLLPILIGSTVPHHNEKWQNYLILLDILDLLFAKRITEDTPGILHELITEHHTNFRQLYPDESITPKMHFLIHTPRIMME